MTSILRRLHVAPEGIRDRPHRSPDGRLTDAGIDGVLVERPPRHIDHRGSLFEAINTSRPFWSEPVVHSEWIELSPGMIKDWGLHLQSAERYVAGSGSDSCRLARRASRFAELRANRPVPLR